VVGAPEMLEALLVSDHRVRNLRSVGLQLVRNLHFLSWAMTERGSGAVAINQALEFSEQSIKGVGQGMTHDRQHHAAGPLACPAKKVSGHECKKE
jgi:hypothetical protein